jgi:hypothetical protein
MDKKDIDKKIDNSVVDKKKEVELNKEFLDNHLIASDKEYELLLNRMNQKRKDQFKNT